MKRFFKATLSLILALCLALPLTLGVLADSYVTQTAMVRALATTLQTEAPLDTEYTKKSPYGGAEGNLGFAQTFFYRLFLTELGGADLTQSTALTTISHFAAGDENAASTIPAARGALRFGDVIQYGPSGHISIVLGECEKSVVVLDCGYGEENGRVVRMRMVSEDELKTQALLAGDRGGLYFFRSLNLPTADITLNLVTKPSSLSYYKEAAPSPHGALLEYYSQQTGKVEIKPDNTELKVFASTKEAGDAPMLFLYGSAITFCRLEVKNETVESVKIETMPAKLEYTTEEEVDMTGAVVTAKMLDGTTLTLTEADYTLTYAFTTPGSATVTLSYGGKSTTFAVAVKEPPVTKLTIVPPAKTTYYVGERLDLTGGSIVVDYEKEKNVTKEMLESMLSTYDTTIPGEAVITVTYGEQSASFTITVLENKVASLSLITSLGKQYRQGSSIDLARVELLVTYEDGQSRTIDARDCVVTINGKTSSTFEKAGEAEIVFTYQGVSTGTVAVKVAEDPMNTFIIAAIIIVSLLIGVPLVILLIIFLVRRAKDKREEARHPIRRYTEETAEEIASFEEEDEEELRIFEERAKNSDTVALPKIATGMPSIHPAEDTPTIQIPKASDSSALDGTRKIDFFDEL